MHEVIMIGAGTTSAVAAYHLANHGTCDILVLDMGLASRGLLRPRLASTTTTPGLLGPHSPSPDLLGMMEEKEEENVSYEPENSGLVVFNCGHDGPRMIKMIMTLCHPTWTSWDSLSTTAEPA
jgi:hypothetical protein